MSKKFTRPEVRRILGEAHTDEIENELIALYLGVVDPMKDELTKYKADAEKLPDVQKELDKLKEAAKKGDPFEKKYNDLKAEYDSYKADVTAKETKAAKEAAVKTYFKEKNITGNNLELALKGAKDEISAIEISDGKIKDTTALDGLVSGLFSGLVSKTGTVGANVPHPPANNGGQPKEKSRAAELAAKYHANLYGSDSKGQNAGA